jgi:TolB-like protein
MWPEEPACGGQPIAIRGAGVEIQTIPKALMTGRTPRAEVLSAGEANGTERKLTLFKDLKERRVFRYLVAYCAGGWAALEVVDQLTGNEVLPGWIYRATLSLVLCGLPGALIVSWYHGAKGRQEVSRTERGLLAAVALFALITTGFVARAGLAATAAAGQPPGLSEFADPSRVAVLYFEPRGGEDAEFLASGLTEALIDELSAVEGLFVVSRNGSELFRNVAASPDSVGRTLRAGSIVSGTVAQAGDRVRVTVTLANASTGDQYASKPFERPRSEIFTLQDELADTISVFLRREIGSELGNAQLRAGTRSVDAWETVQRGQQAANGATVLVSSNDLEGASRALASADSIFAQAETHDPSWIEPIVRRGKLAYRQSRLGGMDRSHYADWIRIGLEHADRALAIDPRHGDALELRATLIYWKYLLNLGDGPSETQTLLTQAETGLRDAIAAGGVRASAHTSLSHLLLNKGEVPEAKLQGTRAYEADPFLDNANLTIWRIFTAAWSLQDVIEARRYCEEGLRRFPNDYRFRQCQLWLFSLPGQALDLEHAWQLVDEFAELSPPQVSEVNRKRGEVFVAMAMARGAATLHDSARAVLVRARATPEIDPTREVALFESIARTWLGDIDEAVRQLSVYFAANPGADEGYRTGVQNGELPWYHQPLITESRFLSLVNAR